MAVTEQPPAPAEQRVYRRLTLAAFVVLPLLLGLAGFAIGRRYNPGPTLIDDARILSRGITINCGREP